MFILKAEWGEVRRAAIRWAIHGPDSRQQIPEWNHPEQQATGGAAKWQPIPTLS